MTQQRLVNGLIVAQRSIAYATPVFERRGPCCTGCKINSPDLAVLERNHRVVLWLGVVGATNIGCRHLVLGPVLVTATFGVPAAIYAEGALAFIGLGLAPPTPSWGRMVADSFATIFVAPHLVVSSCLAVAVTMMSFTFIGDGLRDALDPRAPRRSLPGRDRAPQRTSGKAEEQRAA